jgi:DnaJ-class molecular chaperone
MTTRDTYVYCPNCIGMGFVFTNEDDEDCPRSPSPEGCVMDGCTCEAPCPECKGQGYIRADARPYGRKEKRICPDSRSN